MDDEHIKLVAKVQHFYEIMLAKNAYILDEAILSEPPESQYSLKTSYEITELINEYEKAFEAFLYR